ncbi:MAG: molybdopterin-dependent oxidoreductase [Candidatus Bipolaricaulia bacterium]
MKMRDRACWAGLALLVALLLSSGLAHLWLWPLLPTQSGVVKAAGEAEWALTVTIAETEFKFTIEEIKALPAGEVEFHGHIYRGVPLRTLLAQTGADIGKLESVEAIAADGYRLGYERRLLKRFDFILAYEMDGEPLPREMGPLRIIFPGGRSAQMMKMVEKLIVKLGEWRLTLVLGAEEEKEFTLPELARLPRREVQADSKVYKGVPLEALLLEAGVDLDSVQTASVMASSGYSGDYGREVLSEPLLAYEVDGGPLPAELGTVACLFKGEVQVVVVERVIVAFRAE